MTRIDFYGLHELRPEARERFAVRLLARAFRQGLRSVVLLVQDSITLERLSHTLWAAPHTFLPNAPLTQRTAGPVPVLLATPEELTQDALTGHTAELLVNLTDSEPPAIFATFERVAEIVCQAEESLARARSNYRFYQHQGYQLDYHELHPEPRHKVLP